MILEYIRCKRPAATTVRYWAILNKATNQLRFFLYKWQMIAFGHTEWGGTLQSVTKTKTINPEIMIWLPEDAGSSRMEGDKFIYTGNDARFVTETGALVPEVKIWWFVKNTTITKNIPSESVILAAAKELELKSFPDVFDEKLTPKMVEHLPIIATFFDRVKMNESLHPAWYTSLEIQDIIEQFSYFFLDQRISSPDTRLILCTALATGFVAGFETGVHTSKRFAVPIHGGALLPLKISGHAVDFTNIRAYSQETIDR
jgi:hypothetical protein